SSSSAQASLLCGGPAATRWGGHQLSFEEILSEAPCSREMDECSCRTNSETTGEERYARATVRNHDSSLALSRPVTPRGGYSTPRSRSPFRALWTAARNQQASA